MDRRSFIKTASMVAAAGAAGGSFAQQSGVRRPAAAETVRVAIAGTNSRGRELATQFAGLRGCEVAWICDPEDRAAAKGVRAVEQAGGATPRVVRDVRRALDDPSVHVLVVATPDHWHAPMTLMAMAAGKSVYLEKPCSHNCAEGEMLIASQRKYPQQVIQMGNQRRSSSAVREAVSAIRGGLLGRAYHAKTWYCRKRDGIGRGKIVPVPSHLDWDLWQGPAPRRPFLDNIVHYDWHWRWHWGTGETNNNACHELDVSRWALDVRMPTRVTSTAARHRQDYADDWEFWDIQQVGLEYPDHKTIFWEGHSVDNVFQFGKGRGTMIFGELGHMDIGENSYEAFDHDGKPIAKYGERAAGDTTDTAAPTRDLTRAHCENLLEAVRGRATHNSPIDEGHRSVAICHLANIAQRIGRSLLTDPETGHIRGDAAAEEMWGRGYEPGWEPSV